MDVTAALKLVEIHSLWKIAGIELESITQTRFRDTFKKRYHFLTHDIKHLQTGWVGFPNNKADGSAARERVRIIGQGIGFTESAGRFRRFSYFVAAGAVDLIRHAVIHRIIIVPDRYIQLTAVGSDIAGIIQNVHMDGIDPAIGILVALPAHINRLAI